MEYVVDISNLMWVPHLKLMIIVKNMDMSIIKVNMWALIILAARKSVLNAMKDINLMKIINVKK